MSEAIIITQMYKVERIALRCIRFRRGWKVVLCLFAKKRILWDLTKATCQLKHEQRLYVDMVDKCVTSTQLEKFLHTQNIQLT